MNRYTLIGYPLGHSVSPQIHERLFRLSGCEDCDYCLTAIPPEELAARFGELKQLNGFNVTIPHKQAVIPLLDRLDGTAARYGAVNTVRRDTQGHFTGCNTDVVGFLRSVEALGTAIPGNTVLVLGYGGAGRMMALEAAHQGAASVTVAARAKSRAGAKALVAEVLERYPDCRAETADLANVKGPYGLICNSTPVGMYPNTNASPLSPEALAGSAALFDAVYNPGETLLMRDARQAGLRVAGGMAMLVWQAAAAQEIWYGARFDPADIQRITEEMEQVIRTEFQTNEKE